MKYDHHKKAGNRGDCVKHPALIAALDDVLQHQSSDRFHYLDAFAGHAWHPLLEGEDYEWAEGIGQLADRSLPANAPESVKCWWRMWRSAPDWPTTTPPGYPGSSWIAASCCCKVGKRFSFDLYDHCQEARADLKRAFPTPHRIQFANPNVCRIQESLAPSEEKQEFIQKADFVTVDPPRFAGGEMPPWRPYFQYVLHPRAERPTFMWLPASGSEQDWERLTQYRDPSQNNPIIKERNPGFFQQLAECRFVGYQWTAVRWVKGGSNAACILVYNCAAAAIQAAVKIVAEMTRWEVQHSHQITPNH